MLIALVSGALGLVLLRTAFAPNPDPREVLGELLGGNLTFGNVANAATRQVRFDPGSFFIPGEVGSGNDDAKPATEAEDPADRKFFDLPELPPFPRSRMVGPQ